MKQYILTGMFGFILILPGLMFLFPQFKFERKAENRRFNDSIVFNLSKMDKFPKDFDNFFEDNFPFRSPLLDIHHRIKFHVFNVSANEDKALFGKDNWFFLGGEEKKLVEGRLNFNSTQLDSLTKIWQARKKYLKDSNIQLYWVICPVKHRVYADKLPFSIHLDETNNRTKSMLNSLNPILGGNIIEPSDILKTARKNHDMYYKLDNHWNFRAGYIVTDQLINKIKEDFKIKNELNTIDFEWTKVKKRSGIHYDALNIPELFEIEEIVDNPTNCANEVEKFNFSPPEGFPYPWEYERRFKKKGVNKLKVIIIRDSFADAMLPFLKESFGETLFIFDAWKYGDNREIIEKFKPDLVIYITLESHIR